MPHVVGAGAPAGRSGGPAGARLATARIGRPASPTSTTYRGGGVPDLRLVSPPGPERRPPGPRSPSGAAGPCWPSWACSWSALLFR